MGIYETDRERRIVGDNVVAKRETFHEISAAVGEACDYFARKHDGLQVAVEERLRADGDDDVARRARDSTWARALQAYANAYGRLELALSPDWLNTPAPESVVAVRQRLFPLGPPSTVAGSVQLTLDAITHLVAAIGHETGLHFPEAFVASFVEFRGQLGTALAATSTAREAASRAAQRVFAAREQWDTAYQAFKDITIGYLRLSGQKERLRGLFVELPSTSRSPGPAEPNPASVPSEAIPTSDVPAAAAPPATAVAA